MNHLALKKKVPVRNVLLVIQSELFRNAVNIDSYFEEQIMSSHLVLSFCQMLGQH